MAYMKQENKKEKLAAMKKMIAEKYPELKVKFTMGVRHHSTLVFNLMASTIDFMEIEYKKAIKRAEFEDLFLAPVKQTNLQINEYWIREHFEGLARDFLLDIKKIMNKGNHDNSDISTDYFDVGWYTTINIGKWDRDYILIAS